MKITTKLAFACTILAAAALGATPAQAVPHLPTDPPPRPTASVLSADIQTLVATRKASEPKPLDRGSYSVAVIPRISYPLPTQEISDGWGNRTCAGPCSAFHHGIDFPSAGGTPIQVIAAGVVRSVGYDGLYGNKVVVDHVIDGQAVSSVYGHLRNDSFAVHAGDAVNRGDVLGEVGDTGQSYGNHLHLEIHVDGVRVDPAGWLVAHDALPSPGL